MKSRLVTALAFVGLVAVACSSGNPIATVGSVTITDERVNAFHESGEAAGDFGCTLGFLISSEVFAEAARTRLGITVSGGDIDDYLASPPAHRAEAMNDLDAGGFSDDGVREQVRRWVLVDRIVDARLLADEELFGELVPADAPDAASDSPSPYLATADRRSVIDGWQAEVVGEADVAEVVVDPLFGSWTTEDLSARDACAAAVLARVGGVGITEADVRALNDPAFPANEEEFIFELQFLISSELYAQEAAERFDIEVTAEDVAAFIATPPAHRITALVQFQNIGRFSQEGVEAQVRRWIVADEVVTRLVTEDEEILQSLAAAIGLSEEEVVADPLAFLSVEEANRIFNAWTTEIAGEREFAEVEVDPAIGEWEPVFRQLVPAGA